MLRERETATVIMTAQDCLCAAIIIVRRSLEKLEIFMMDLMIAALDFVHLKNHATLHRLKKTVWLMKIACSAYLMHTLEFLLSAPLLRFWYWL